MSSWLRRLTVMRLSRSSSSQKWGSNGPLQDDDPHMAHDVIYDPEAIECCPNRSDPVNDVTQVNDQVLVAYSHLMTPFPFNILHNYGNNDKCGHGKA